MAARTIRTASVGDESVVLYTVPEAANLLRIGRSSLYELIATGQLGSITIGSRRLIPTEDLSEFIASRRDVA